MLSLQSVEKLRALNIFKQVELQLDTAKDENSEEIGGLEVSFMVEEYGRISSSLSASAGSQSGDAVSNQQFQYVAGWQGWCEDVLCWFFLL